MQLCSGLGSVVAHDGELVVQGVVAVVVLRWVRLAYGAVAVLEVLVGFAHGIGLAAVGHQMPAKAHLDNLVGLRVPAVMRTRCMRLGVVAGQR